MTSQISKKQLEKQLQALTETIAHRKTELKTLEPKLSKLKTDIAEATESLREAAIASINKELALYKDKLKSLKKLAEEEQKRLDSIRSQSVEAIDSTNRQDEVLKQRRSVLEEENSALVKENRTIKAEIEVNSKARNKLFNEKANLEEDISTLRLKEGELKEQVVNLRQETEQLSAEKEELEQSHEANVAKKTTEIAKLDHRLREVGQKILDEEAAHKQASEALVERHMALEERDKNLRIREAKVEQQQSKIIRNYNLLNM